MNDQLPPLLNKAIASEKRLDNLLSDSLTLVENALNSSEISLSERVEIALKILDISGVYHQLNRPQNSNDDPEVAETSTTDTPRLLEANFIQVDNFLSPEEQAETFKIAFHNHDKFFPSGVANNEENTRKSSVLLVQNFDEYYNKIRHKILQIRPQILAQLNLPTFLVSWVEMQMTAHNHGDYYYIHQDMDGEKIANRVLTYVYYFYEQPKAFYGGDLRIYPTYINGDGYTIGEQFVTVEPRHNSIIFFDSRMKHEVLPVFCPSGRFEDSRFTINGWIHR